jgi:alkaline phosphatase
VVPEGKAGGPGSSGPFAGYNFVKSTWTDSAAAATAISTGVKTYNSAVNWANEPAVTGSPILRTIVGFAERRGRATGTITTVAWSHATPAGLSMPKNISRSEYVAIANDMLNSNVEVIIGAGHPLFTNNARPGENETEDKVKDGLYDGHDYGYVGGKATWDALVAGSHSSGRALIQTRADFQALADGTYNDGALPRKLVGTAQVYETFQERRNRNRTGDAPDFSNPSSVPFNNGVPSLASITRAALNVLSADGGGFLLQIEGGAVDWANHDNLCDRMVEEQMDFNKAVRAVSDYLTEGVADNTWENTLVIITADHECGMLWGKNSGFIPFEKLHGKGVRVLPDAAYNSDWHTNSLVPLYARGPGSELFAGLVDGVDPHMVAGFGLWQGFDGRYVDNTDIYTVMHEALDGDGVSDAKNVILMISDGAGFNTFTATTMYEYGLPK